MRHHLALAAAIAILTAVAGVPQPLAAKPAQPAQTSQPEPDNFSKAQSFIVAIYPEMAKPRQFYVYFKTLVVPVTPGSANHSSRLTLYVVTAQDLEAAHHHHTPFDPLLFADTNFNKAGEIREFMAHGSRYAHADRTAALHAKLLKQVEMTDDAVLQAFRNAGMRYLPGQRDRLLTHIRPVLAEMERLYGKLAIDDVEEPRREIRDYPQGPHPEATLHWSVSMSTPMGAPKREVRMAFEPYDGRLIMLSVD